MDGKTPCSCGCPYCSGAGEEATLDPVMEALASAITQVPGKKTAKQRMKADEAKTEEALLKLFANISGLIKPDEVEEEDEEEGEGEVVAGPKVKRVTVVKVSPVMSAIRRGLKKKVK